MSKQLAPCSNGREGLPDVHNFVLLLSLSSLTRFSFSYCVTYIDSGGKAKNVVEFLDQILDSEGSMRLLKVQDYAAL